MSTSGTLRRGAGVLTTLLLATGLGAPSATAATTPFQVMSWNMCGSQRATWHCEGTGTPQQKIDVVKGQIRDQNVRAVLLQEVCEDDLTSLMAQLGPAWTKSFAPYQWSQGASGKWNSRCGEDNGRADRIGTAIVLQGQVTDAREYPTTQPYVGQQRPFQCATSAEPAVRLCNVHLSPLGSNPDHPTWDYRDDQLKEIKAIVNTFPGTVFGGDFNALSPDSTNPKDAWVWPAGLYTARPELEGGYRECDQTGTSRTGRATHGSGAKIDYLFSSEVRRGCTVTDTPFSDHHVVVESLEPRYVPQPVRTGGAGA
ncbi:endonuclease/exonuclease/phosphatase family protein [Streptomyces sp. NPDC054904]|uniref:endonuclease/exonuclease/phosphatase family protein n=1 Tax=unclassified Streptomyces TaxID=2593676 RepID=UPI002481EE4F|nr:MULTISPECIES: endonuclease/exonuclease/phosphatase family protein [unclassified Streptomyces]MDA5281744.1 endonuclease/exonuclease/phosphatase family protein [Streptomyces sp. Isolate_45]MDX2393376.1 endonuclease/exonuclease/phosphatase family protein [Streptomyces sp. DK15]